tara:strand:+ start:855 stop:1016 length:162 start_codon:yes stop_codon:yes gene_type:complete
MNIGTQEKKTRTMQKKVKTNSKTKNSNWPSKKPGKASGKKEVITLLNKNDTYF